jgi:hypothetical protein
MVLSREQSRPTLEASLFAINICSLTGFEFSEIL